MANLRSSQIRLSRCSRGKHPWIPLGSSIFLPVFHHLANGFAPWRIHKALKYPPLISLLHTQKDERHISDGYHLKSCLVNVASTMQSTWRVAGWLSPLKPLLREEKSSVLFFDFLEADGRVDSTLSFVPRKVIRLTS